MESPKYRAVYENLRQRIESGGYPVGTRLPTEDELANTFCVSRVTVRRSLDILVSEGFLARRQGSGYSVVTLSPPSANCLASFTDAMMKAGRKPTSRLISLGKRSLDRTVLETLPGNFARRDPFCIERLRLVDRNPEMLVRTYVPKQLLLGVAPADFPEEGSGQSILRILKGRFGLDWGAACEDITAVAAEGEVAEYLQIKTGSPILRQACTAFDGEGELVFYEELYRGGTVTFELAGPARNSVIPASQSQTAAQ